MTVSTATLTPSAPTALGVGATAETPTTTGHAVTVLRDTFGGLEVLETRRLPGGDYDPAAGLVDRANRTKVHAGYQQWQEHVASAAACSHPVRLAGDLHTVDKATGEILATRSTSDMPDGVLYKACGNRRASVCPACAETYRADAYQLIKAGLAGGKGIEPEVRNHPALFVTFTAPSFGLVHSHRFNRKTGNVSPCRSRATADICPHGRDLRCFIRHGKGDKSIGTPLCLDCYDYPAHVVWHGFASHELWRRTQQEINRQLARRLGTKWVKVNYSKVAEYQTRGAIHYHAIIRLDGINPEDKKVIPPPQGASVSLLEKVIRDAVTRTQYLSPPHPQNEQGWWITWGQQLDIRTLRTGIPGDTEITGEQVAGYIAKYATKSTEATGRTTRRLADTTINEHADPDGDHTARLINAAWQLGNVGPDLKPDGTFKESPYRRLRRAAHQYGYGGHFLTKSRKYSATFRVLRQTRQTFKRARVTTTRYDGTQLTAEETHIVSTLHFVASGWNTNADQQLANSTAARAREWKALAATEINHQPTKGI